MIGPFEARASDDDAASDPMEKFKLNDRIYDPSSHLTPQERGDMVLPGKK